MNIYMNPEETETTTTSQTEPDFINLCSYPIDGPIEDWRHRFPISMLRVGRILLKNTDEVMGVSETRVSKLMAKHRNETAGYSPLQSREELHKFHGEIRGGGIRIEWTENLHKRYRSVPHYDFTFSRVYKPDDCIILNQLSDPTTP